MELSINYRDSHWRYVMCRNCRVSTDLFGNDKAAAEAWNRRTWQPQPFTVIDNTTGEYPNLERIALKEDWAKGLIYCDMEGFALDESGNLVLMDECGNMAYCPADRFTVIEEANDDAE